MAYSKVLVQLVHRYIETLLKEILTILNFRLCAARLDFQLYEI